MRRALVALVLLTACAAPAPAPPPIDHTVAVLPPTNRTGDPLLVAGASLLERYALRTDRVTVPDVLAAEARVQLARRGFTVVPAADVDAATRGRAPASVEGAAEIAARAKLPGLALYLDVRRWEPDAPTHPAFVIVALGASLVEPATARIVWSAERRAAPVATPGQVTLGEAYITAADKVMKDVLGPLGAERPPPP